MGKQKRAEELIRKEESEDISSLTQTEIRSPRGKGSLYGGSSNMKAYQGCVFTLVSTPHLLPLYIFLLFSAA